MNEQEFHKILQESIISPSDSFSYELMRKVELEAAGIRSMRWMPVLLGAGCLITLFFLVVVTMPSIVFLGFSIPIPPMGIQVVGIFFILYEVHQLFDLHRKLTLISTMTDKTTA